MSRNKVHAFNSSKAFKEGKATWVPTVCGTRVAMALYVIAHAYEKVTCKLCLKILGKSK